MQERKLATLIPPFRGQLGEVSYLIEVDRVIVCALRVRCAGGGMSADCGEGPRLVYMQSSTASASEMKADETRHEQV